MLMLMTCSVVSS